MLLRIEERTAGDYVLLKPSIIHSTSKKNPADNLNNQTRSVSLPG